MDQHGAGQTPAVFIDGEAGTAGLEIRRRLAAIPEIRVLSLDPLRRKDRDVRQQAMAGADLAVLCLPDEAAREAVALADELGEAAPRLLDASTAHRVAPGWVYGFAELAPGQDAAIRAARRTANPGCYATGAIALLRPLVARGLLPPDFPLAINAVSGYSGGGRTMIESYERGEAPAFELYALSLEHKHLPEIVCHAGLARMPVFVPSVGNFRQGMLVSIPLHLDTLPGRLSPADLREALAAWYRETPGVEVAAERPARLAAEALSGTDRLDLFVFGDPAGHRAVLAARLDNLGKGAAGAAVQNIRLMLGLGV